MPDDTEKRIRILHVQDKCGHGGSQIQGVQRLLLWWWPEFKNSEFELSLCILRGRNEASQSFDDAGIGVTYLNRGKFDPRTLIDLVRIVKKEKIQILHCHGYGSTTFGRLAGAICRVPVVVHEHMVDAAIPFYQKFIDKLLASRTARGIAVSMAVRDFMAGPRGLARDKIEVIYNGLPSEFCRTFTKKEIAAIRTEMKADQNHIVIGTVGRLHRLKGQFDFLYAAKEVLKSNPDALFVIVGDGETRVELEELCSKLEIEDFVVFLGFRDDIARIMSGLDVLVVPSHSEGFGLTVIEAMAAGKEVVATNVGGIPEIIEHRVNGILVEKAEPKQLAHAINSLLNDAPLRNQLRENGRERFNQEFTMAKSIAKYSKLYHELSSTS